MTIKDKHEIPMQINDGDADSAAQPLSDDSLDGLAGGAKDLEDRPSCTMEEELSEDDKAVLETYNKSQAELARR